MIGMHILLNRMFCFANAAKNSKLIEFFFLPYDDGMIFAFLMTFVAWIICITAFEFDSNNVFLGCIMLTPCLIIYCKSVNVYQALLPSPSTYIYFLLYQIYIDGFSLTFYEYIICNFCKMTLF